MDVGHRMSIYKCKHRIYRREKKLQSISTSFVNFNFNQCAKQNELEKYEIHVAIITLDGGSFLSFSIYVDDDDEMNETNNLFLAILVIHLECHSSTW